MATLEGRLRIVLDDGREWTLARGEAAELPTWRPHWIAGPAELLVLFDPSGEPLRPHRFEPDSH